jgi:hypothetical protein
MHFALFLHSFGFTYVGIGLPSNGLPSYDGKDDFRPLWTDGLVARYHGNLA